MQTKTCKHYPKGLTQCVQTVGLLSAVGSLTLIVQESVVFLNWTEPFRLANVDGTPELDYCVEVVNSSASGEPMLVSECGINVTEFSYPIPPLRWCHRYLTVVTPVNMAGRGILEAAYFQYERA